MKIVIAGGSGLIGQALAQRLVDMGHDVVVLTRGAPITVGRSVVWDPGRVGSWAVELEHCYAVVNLCGAGIGERRWSAARKQEILSSRVGPARVLAQACAQLPTAPSVVIQASGVGYYGNDESQRFTEAAPAGADYLAGLAAQWEAAGADDWPVAVRRVVARIGVVWSARGGALEKLLLPFRLFVGGRLGSGAQPLSWIHIDDLTAALVHVLFSSAQRGPINCCAPEAPSNAELARTIGAALGRPAWLPTPALALRLLLGEMATLVLQGQRVYPQALLDDGFEFRFATAQSALADLLAPS